MRPLLAGLVLLAPLLGGCLGPLSPASTVDVLPLVLEEAPANATVEVLPDGLRLTWTGVKLPFEETFPIPAGATLVRATGIVGADELVVVSMRHAETERRRCNFAPVDAWDAPVLGRASCTGVTAVDRLPDKWIVRAASVAAKATVQVDVLATPYDGLLAQLDLTQLSMRDHELAPTEVLALPSFDGTPLRVEVTRPEGRGPWPVILWSSPYNHADRLASGSPAAWKYFVRDWAERGYVVVSADVRGYGDSGGCVEVWGPREQADQAFLVEWARKQEWSDGHVGFYGQSYVATTPVEAAVQGVEGLDAIVIVAPVTDAYTDWHFGGVPNGENLLSPVGYQQTGGGVNPFAALRPTTLPDALPYAADRADNGYCDPSILVRPNDPRALYDAFYVERNFSARAKDVMAATLYTQGFEDSNVKSALIPDWFNAITAPKLGLFGHWVHQHPTRADNEALMLGWMDQHVKGKPVGFERLREVQVVTNAGTHRADDAWPPLDPRLRKLGFDLDAGALAEGEGAGRASLLLDPLHDGGGLPLSPLSLLGQSTLLALESAPLAEVLHVAGQPDLALSGTLERAENGYVAAYLHEKGPEGTRLVTWGMLNLAHRNGHDRHEPVRPGETFHASLPFLPTEWVFQPGTQLLLEVRGARVTDWALVQPGEAGTLHLDGAATLLRLPTVDPATAEPLPATAQR